MCTLLIVLLRSKDVIPKKYFLTTMMPSGFMKKVTNFSNQYFFQLKIVQGQKFDNESIETKIYVGNIGESVTKDNLQQLFEKYGRVEECDIIKNYGFVHMSNDTEAKTAIESINDTEFLGTRLSVEQSHSRVRQKPGMGGRSQCYRCGRSGHWSKDCPRGPRGGGSFRDRYGPPSMPPPPSYRDRMMSSRYGSEGRMRPYPDIYDRRPAPPLPPPRDDPYYRRSPYEPVSYPGYDDRPRSMYDGYSSYGGGGGSSYGGGGGGGGGGGNYGGSGGYSRYSDSYSEMTELAVDIGMSSRFQILQLQWNNVKHANNSDVEYEPMESDNETIDSYESDDVLSEHEDDSVMLSDSWKRIADIFSDCRPNSLPELVRNFSGINPALN
ncbi:RNA-binding protein lark [Nymphon striatum]|nr:RNA-binding protein lark [Nymphon striatum]